MLVVYVGLIGLTAWQFGRAPTGFIPEQDQGYLITVIQLPPGASLARTDAVVKQATKLILDTEGIEHAVPFSGFDGATFTNASNAGAIFSALRRLSHERDAKGLTGDAPAGRAEPEALQRSRTPSSSPSRRRPCAASAPAAASR